ncbi:hypothetical protein BD560DRAFT_440315 [Blakeslea trispora]|nr:hypothetical protein BD560DRAFT_440315 [Blakeslea trispora]
MSTNSLMNTAFYLAFAASLLLAVSHALPVFDTELVASPFVHEVRISYRGGRAVNVRDPKEA